MRIREAKPGDESKLSSFLKDAWREAGPGAPGFTGATQETIEELASLDFLKRLLANPRNKIFVAEDENKFIGFVSSRESGDEFIELSGIIVLNSRVGEGVGTQLLRMVKSSIPLGYHKKIVKTEVSNDRAIKFYEKMGFSEAGRATEKIDSTPVDLVILSIII